MFPLRAFYWGQKGARDNFSLQIRNIVEAGYRSLGEKPVIIGEAGIPMDMKYVTDVLLPRFNRFTRLLAMDRHSRLRDGHISLG